jgi:hypothetical protein
MRDQRHPYQPIYDRRRRETRVGRVGFDSVGNVYRHDPGEAADPLRLDNPDLALVDDPQARHALENRSGASAGYNPYGSGLLIRQDQRGPRRDLRALSSWIESKRRAAENGD